MRAEARDTGEILERASTETLVLLTEEHGYRDWFWFPRMDAPRLVEWWERLISVDPYFLTPEPLPGDLILVDREGYDTFNELKARRRHFEAHTHCDDDSFLLTPDGVRILHAGFPRTD